MIIQAIFCLILCILDILSANEIFSLNYNTHIDALMNMSKVQTGKIILETRRFPGSHNGDAELWVYDDAYRKSPENSSHVIMTWRTGKYGLGYCVYSINESIHQWKPHTVTDNFEIFNAHNVTRRQNFDAGDARSIVFNHKYFIEYWICIAIRRKPFFCTMHISLMYYSDHFKALYTIPPLTRMTIEEELGRHSEKNWGPFQYNFNTSKESQRLYYTIIQSRDMMQTSPSEVIYSAYFNQSDLGRATTTQQTTDSDRPHRPTDNGLMEVVHVYSIDPHRVILGNISLRHLQQQGGGPGGGGGSDHEVMKMTTICLTENDPPIDNKAYHKASLAASATAGGAAARSQHHHTQHPYHNNNNNSIHTNRTASTVNEGLWKYGTPRGGTPAKLIYTAKTGWQYLTFFHSSFNHPYKKQVAIEQTYYAGAYLFAAQPPFQITYLMLDPIVCDVCYNESYGWTYPSHLDYVVFPMSFMMSRYDQDKLCVTFGKNDRQLWTMAVSLKELVKGMIKVPGKVKTLMNKFAATAV